MRVILMLDMDGETEHRDLTVCEMIQAYESYRSQKAERGMLTSEALAPAPLRSVEARRTEIFVLFLIPPA